MDKFKVKTGSAQVLPINNENYIKTTGKNTPYCRQDRKGHQSLYAVCPACDNPIQIIGLFKGEKPYGRHYKGSIPGLAKYNADNYFNCPYSHPHPK